MFDVGFSEILVILLVVLLLFGPDKLPEMAKKIGKVMGQFRRQSDALRREFYNSVYNPAEDFKKQLDLGARELRAAKDELTREVAGPLESKPGDPPSAKTENEPNSIDQGKSNG